MRSPRVCAAHPQRDEGTGLTALAPKGENEQRCVECLTKLSRKTELRYGAPAELRLLAELRLPLLSRALSLSLPPYYLI